MSNYMTVTRCLFLFALTSSLAHGQAEHKAQPVPKLKPAEALVQSLYTEVLARHPIGIPEGADEKVFAPYLSKSLLRQLKISAACGADWYRQFPDPELKPEIAWLETGLFSGGDEYAEPSSFVIEKMTPEKDGSARVQVRLTYADTRAPDPPLIWRAVAFLLKEDEHYVVNDVFVQAEPTRGAGWRLSKLLRAGCDGAHWVGFARMHR